MWQRGVASREVLPAGASEDDVKAKHLYKTPVNQYYIYIIYIILWRLDRLDAFKLEPLPWRAVCRALEECWDLGFGYEGDDCSAGWPALQLEGMVCDVRHAAAVGDLLLLGRGGCADLAPGLLSRHLLEIGLRR